MAGSLYVVSTPIGNMEDITLRALRVLGSVALIAAEDTRVTRKLLTRHSIRTPVTSYHAHNEREKAPELLERLTAGEDVALVTDAGTPGISDPGFRLIRLALSGLVKVVPVPGPSAIITAVSVAGVPADEFTFLGFAPHGEAGRRDFFLRLKQGGERTYIFYESAKRIRETLKAMVEVLGDIEVAVMRELTKVHEEVMRGRASALLRDIEERTLKGEITVVARTEAARMEKRDFRAEAERLIREGLGLRDIAKMLSMDFGIPRREAYKEALKVKEGLGTGGGGV